MTTFEGSLQQQFVDNSPRSRRIARSTFAFIRRYPIGAFSAVYIVVIIVVAIIGPWIAPFDYYRSIGIPIQGPSGDHWFGTDEVGRDIFSRILGGARITVRIGFIALFGATALGSFVGLVSGYFGGVMDALIQRVVDSLMAIPLILLALMIVFVFGSSTNNVVLALSLVIAPSVSRVVRSAVLAERTKDYVLAAQVIGAGQLRVMFRHLAVNLAPLVIVIMSINVGQIVIAESSLSFLGLGTQPPEPSWGRMLSGASRLFMTQNPWMAVFPGLALFTVVMAFNLLGDTLRDSLDPRLRGSR